MRPSKTAQCPPPAPSADDGRTTARVDAKRRRASRSRRTSSTGRPSRTPTGMPARPSPRQARTPTAAGATIARARPVKRRLGPLKKTPCAGLNPSWTRPVLAAGPFWRAPPVDPLGLQARVGLPNGAQPPGMGTKSPAIAASTQGAALRGVSAGSVRLCRAPIARRLGLGLGGAPGCPCVMR